MGLKNLIGMYDDRSLREAFQGMFGVVSTSDGVTLHLFSLEITFGSTSISVKKKGATSNIFSFNYNTTTVAKATTATAANFLNWSVNNSAAATVPIDTNLRTSSFVCVFPGNNTSGTAWTANITSFYSNHPTILVCHCGGQLTITNDYTARYYTRIDGVLNYVEVGSTFTITMRKGAIVTFVRYGSAFFVSSAAESNATTTSNT